MGRSILKEQPKGSELARYVNHLVGSAAEGPPLWQSEDREMKALGVVLLGKEEHRIWKWPREIVRDHLILPMIADNEGEVAAAAVRLHTPRLLDDYTELYCDRAKRVAKPSERKPPVPNSEAIVIIVVTAFFIELSEPTLSKNANYVRVAERLDIDRHSVRRIVQRVSRGLMSTNEETAAAMRGLIEAGRRLIREVDGTDAKLVQKNGTRNRIALNKQSPHH